MTCFLKSGKPQNDRDYTKIHLKGSELDSRMEPPRANFQPVSFIVDDDDSCIGVPKTKTRENNTVEKLQNTKP